LSNGLSDRALYLITSKPAELLFNEELESFTFTHVRGPVCIFRMLKDSAHYQDCPNQLTRNQCTKLVEEKARNSTKLVKQALVVHEHNFSLKKLFGSSTTYNPYQELREKHNNISLHDVAAKTNHLFLVKEYIHKSECSDKHKCYLYGTKVNRVLVIGLVETETYPMQ
jgi:hypothetical protein